MPAPNRLQAGLKAARELGPKPLALFAAYQLGLHTGALRRKTQPPPLAAGAQDMSFKLQLTLRLPGRDTITALLGEQEESLFSQAGEILAGQIRPFSGAPQPLSFSQSTASIHWTEYALGRRPWGVEDVKFLWEPARFVWAYTLARAYHLSQDERYAEAFWHHTEDFLRANPPYLGPQWASAQEVALRMIALSFAIHVFSPSPHTTPERVSMLGAALAAHAARIPPTLAYARAQGNNHLLTEAMGLYTAGLLLPAHPRSARWQALGWHWFAHALRTQIAEDGSYIQQSTNYHRLMLQAALWGHALARNEGRELPPDVLSRLQAATRWALALLDQQSGRVPNLGPNDGAYIQPLTSLPFGDYRPVLGAAGLAFLGVCPFPPGIWLETAAWYGLPTPAWPSAEEEGACPKPNQDLSAVERRRPAPTLYNAGSSSWAYLRVARFTRRPGHADQLHLDLWWQGLNLAIDPGTYLYNAPPPWDNALMGTAVHNTIMVDGLDQMTRAGRFLWLDWAQGEILDRKTAPDGSAIAITARHDGYRMIGLDHQRTVQACPDGRWVIQDRIVPRTTSANQAPHTARLHWLLPDWPWELQPVSEQEAALALESPYGQVRLQVGASLPETGTSEGRGKALPEGSAHFELVRAGENLTGREKVPATWGWASVTYGKKTPALSFAATVCRPAPIAFISEWILP